MIYFDNAATTNLSQGAMDLIHQILTEDWGNPSSLHKKGIEAERHLEKARKILSDILGVKPKQLIFTSCATESNNTAIRSALYNKKDANIVLSSVEHASIDTLAKNLARQGIEVRYLSVDQHGQIDRDQIQDLVDEKTGIFCLMHVNNELGTIYPVEEVASLVKEKNKRTKVLVDGVQAFAKIDFSLGASQIDFYSASAHKVHGPKGIGFLYIKDDSDFHPLMLGGGHENKKRAGTPNVAFAAGFAKAAQEEVEAQAYDHVVQLSKQARKRVEKIPDHIINSPAQASPYILNLGFKDIKAEVLLRFMEQEDMYLSSGSACAGNATSHVLQAIGLGDEFIDGCVRISFERKNTLEEVDTFFDRMEESIASIRKLIGN